jgi:hypothetical protein
MEPTCHTSQVWSHLPRATSSLPNTSFPVCTTWMNEIDQGKVSLIEWMKLWSLGSMGPPLRPINRHNSHSKTILCVTKRKRFIPPHRGGSAAPPNLHTNQNWCEALTLNRLRSKNQERPSQEAMDHRAGRTPWSARTYENGPTHSTDLTYR